MPADRQLEGNLARVITAFKKETLGQGPAEVKVTLTEDLIIVRLRRLLPMPLLKLLEASRESWSRMIMLELWTNFFRVHEARLAKLLQPLIHKEIAVRSFNFDDKTGDGLLVLAFTEEPAEITLGKEMDAD